MILFETSSQLAHSSLKLRTAVLTAGLLGLGASSGTLGASSGALFASSDFRSFRGESGRGTASEAPFTSALKRSWTRPIGSAYSGISIAEGLLITAEARDGRDRIVALDAKTGTTRWSLDLAEAYIGHGGSLDGIIATPAIDADRVFVVGPRGQVVSIELASGSEIWRQNLGVVDPETETEAPYYGFASSPLVLDNLVVVQVGNPGGAAVALDRTTGAIAWRTEGDLIEAQSPIAMFVGGKQQILVASNTALVGLNPEEGAVQWSYPVDANSAFSLTTSPLPLPDGTIFFTPQDDRSVVIRPPAGGSATVGAEPPQPELIWEANVLTRTYSPAALIGDTLVGYTSRFLAAYSSKDGSRLWRSRTPGDGFLIGMGDTQAVIVTKDGSLHLGTIQDGWTEQWNEEVFDELVWTPPSYADQAIYVRSMTEIARFDLQTDQVTSLNSGPTLPSVLANLTDRSEAGINRFLDGKQTPLVEGDRALFLWRGDAQDVGIAGDLLGMRREDSFQKLGDSDLWWYEVQLNKVLDYSYVLYVDYEPTLDPLNPRREFNTVMGWNANWVSPRTPPVEMSAFAMPEHPGPPAHLRPDAEEPARTGRLSELLITGDEDLIRTAAAELGIEGEELEGRRSSSDESSRSRYPCGCHPGTRSPRTATRWSTFSRVLERSMRRVADGSTHSTGARGRTSHLSSPSSWTARFLARFRHRPSWLRSTSSFVRARTATVAPSFPWGW